MALSLPQSLRPFSSRGREAIDGRLARDISGNSRQEDNRAVTHFLETSPAAVLCRPVTDPLAKYSVGAAQGPASVDMPLLLIRDPNGSILQACPDQPKRDRLPFLDRYLTL